MGSVAIACGRGKPAKFDGISNAALTECMDEREIWLKISNSCAAIAGRPSRFLPRIRSSSAIVVIPRLSAANHAARPRRTNSRVAAAAAGSSAVQLRAQASSAPGADSKPLSHSSHEVTVPSTARTASRAGRPVRVVATGEALAVEAVRTSCLPQPCLPPRG